ncbi:MAG: single-stranded-DNA-specific exonuclease RecJ [Tissierellia bacterium]|nr:single-stranded-DNA-specific exonuclease RecJ [Tissierellia bacterium]
MKKWFVKSIKEDIRRLTEEYKIHPVLIRLMLNRDIPEDRFDAFLHPNFKNSAHHPFLMKDLEKAARLIIDRANEGKKIRIVGDYDQDGNSAIMVLLDGLMVISDQLDYDIPHRVDDGYGISRSMVEKAKEDGVDLVITCDNGISAFEPVKRAKELGMEIIVTDHHQTVKDEGIEKIPEADAVVNPQQSKCSYPEKQLCGAGVAYKLIEGIYRIIGEDPLYLKQLLEYVAMGTVCDVVDLKGENRLFVKEGLKILNQSQNYGIQALVRETSLKKEIDSYALGFILGPCINASGRLDSAKRGVELLLEENMEKVDQYAKELVELNNRRKKMTVEGYEEVIKLIEKNQYYNDDIIIVNHNGIHESIAGIIAGRVKDKYHHPTVVFTSSTKEGILKGSGRSIPEYNMFEEFSKTKNLFESFGGHKMASGLSIKEEKLEDFRREINHLSHLTTEDLIEKIHIDSTLYANRITFELIDLISKLEPFGAGNPRPIFGDKGAKIEKISIVGKEENVLRLDLLIRGRKMQAIKFKAEDDILYLKNKFGEKKFAQLIVGMNVDNQIDFCYYPAINEFRDKKNIQLILEDIR